MKHLIVTRVKSADPHVTLYSSLCITKGMQTNLKNKEMGSVSGKIDSPMLLLSCFLFFWPNSHLVHGYPPSLLILPGLLRLDRGASVPPLLRENGKTPAAYVGGDWYSM